MAGNWKMNLNHVEAVGLVQKLTWTLEDKRHDPAKSEVVVLPPFTDLRTVQTLVEGDRLNLGYGAQDLSPFDNGAYTGDISAAMLVKLGCRYVVVGHSERRRFHGEDDNMVNAKTIKAVTGGSPRSSASARDWPCGRSSARCPYTLAHVEGALAGLTADQVKVSSSPTSPCGPSEPDGSPPPRTPRRCAPQSAAGSAEQHGSAVAEEIRILYGGSVNASNVAALMAEADIDGCLVGNASLDVEQFAAIARFYDLPRL